MTDTDQKTDPLWKQEYKQDVVYLHVLPRCNAVKLPNLSPFAIKLELWLRINKIPFQVVDHLGFSRKGQSPFILFNGKQIADSNFCVDFLSKRFNKDPFPGLNDSDRAIGRAFIKMLEENTAWPMFIYRYVEHRDEYLNFYDPNSPWEKRSASLADIGKHVENRANGHGIGRHSSDEVQQIGVDDVKAVSDFLGDKPFVLGDTPTLVDCTLLGVLSQVLYVPMGYPQRSFILEKCPNIARLCDKLKNTYWDSWETECDI